MLRLVRPVDTLLQVIVTTQFTSVFAVLADRVEVEDNGRVWMWFLSLILKMR